MTHEELLHAYQYNPETGGFSRANGKPVRPMISNVGYKRIWHKGRLYQQHRLAWLYVYGQWPKDKIDHINGNREDNRIFNLRECTMSQNAMNTGAHRDNTSGFKGVTRNHNRWMANIKKDGVATYLGTFDTPEEAHAAYAAAAVRVHGQFARVR